MPSVTGRIFKGGPFVDCLASVSNARATALQKLNRPVPSPIQVRALIDTGASCTCIDHGIVERLELFPIGVARIRTPSTTGAAESRSVYDATIQIVMPVGAHVCGIFPVVETTLAVQGFEMLLGRDVLSRCTLIYEGGKGTFTLSF